MAAAAANAQKGLSLAGQAFFGSLCVGTFGLGCWQTQRYFEKIHLVAERQEQLAMEPALDGAVAVTIGVIDWVVNDQASTRSSRSISPRELGASAESCCRPPTTGAMKLAWS